jgi:NADPH:quinone reductase-like Zn-dependent oxidoreductase
MRQIWITKPGPPEVLQVREAPDPDAGPGSLRVRVRAAGINFADLMARLGIYPDAPKIPCVVGYEVAGVIDQLGVGVEGFAVGDRVFAMPRFGGYSDTVVVPAGQVFRMPAQLGFEEAAGMPVVYLTAHHMLLRTGSLHPGMKVLLHSAAGGVGLAAIDLLRAHGCEIFGTASKGKHAFLRERGVVHCLDSSGDVWAEARAILGDARFDLSCNAIGGGTWKKDDALLGPGGRLICYGVSDMARGKRRNLGAIAGFLSGIRFWNAVGLMNTNRTVSGVNMAQLFERLDLLRPQFEALLKMYEAGTIRPHVDRTFPFAEAAAAHHHLHDRKSMGKVVLVP